MTPHLIDQKETLVHHDGKGDWESCIGTKVNVPKLSTIIFCTPIFERYVVRCGSNLCLKEIGLCGQYMLIILGSVIKTIGGEEIYDHLTSTRVFTLMMNKISM